MDSLSLRIALPTVERLIRHGALTLSELYPETADAKAHLRRLILQVEPVPSKAPLDSLIRRLHGQIALFTQLPNAATAAVLLQLSEDLLTHLPAGHCDRYSLRALRGMLQYWQDDGWPTPATAVDKTSRARLSHPSPEGE